METSRRSVILPVSLLAFKGYNAHHRLHRTIQHHGNRLHVPSRFHPFSTSTPSSSSCSTADSRQQRIAIVGAGAVGLYYGARLWSAGHRIELVGVRNHRDALCANGIQIRSTLTGHVRIPPPHPNDDRFRVHETYPPLHEKDPFDWVLVTVKTTGLVDVLPHMIASMLVDPDHTRVILAMNGTPRMDDYCRERLQMQCRALYGGCVFVCVERRVGQPCAVHHSSWSGLGVGIVGTNDNNNNNNDEDHQGPVRELFHNTAVDVHWEESIRKARWKKALINIPINGLSVVLNKDRGGCLVDEILATRRQLVVDLMEEVALLANADLEQANGDQDDDVRITQSDMDRTMQIVERIGPFATSTLVDFRNKTPMEYQWVFRVPLERARELQLQTPLLEWLVTELGKLCAEG